MQGDNVDAPGGSAFRLRPHRWGVPQLGSACSEGQRISYFAHDPVGGYEGRGIRPIAMGGAGAAGAKRIRDFVAPGRVLMNPPSRRERPCFRLKISPGL